MLKNLFGFILVCYSISAIGQQALKDNQFEGYIIMKDGEKKEGIIEVGNHDLPWSFQETVKYFDKSVLAQEKIKTKDKMECKPGDVIEYGINGRKFLFVSYSNSNSDSSNGLNQGISALKNATQTKYFAEITREGLVSVYRFYNSPSGFAMTSGDEQANERREYVQDCLTKYDILISKEGEKAKAFDQVNVKKFFKDCELVVNKYKDGLYIKKPVKGLKSFIKDGMLRGSALEKSAIEIIEDYEANCSK